MIAEHFHFIRPAWLWALLPLLILLWRLWRQKLQERAWRNVIDPALRPHILIGETAQTRSWSLAVTALAGILAITALAGPAWEQLEQPVFRQDSALVVLLDLSRSMDASDIKPTRLQRTKLKLRDILKQRKEGQTALIAYAGLPFVVSPLTDDTKTIISQLSGLSSELMPVQGSRVDRAIAKAGELLQQAGMKNGAVLLLTDGIEGAPEDSLDNEIQHLLADGHKLLVLGVGTIEGAPIPEANGGFYKDAEGAIILPKLDPAALSTLAEQGQGVYRELSADDRDINVLLSQVDARSDPQHNEQIDNMKSDQWQDEGVWLLLPLLVIAALGFRRGYLLVVLILVLPQPQTAYALSWDELWLRDDQRAQQAYENGDTKQAAELFEDREWRAAAHYRNGDHEAALKDLESIDSARGFYNRGNALAKMQRFPEALDAYEEALKHDPDMEDARYNRDLVKQWLQQNEQQQDKQQNGDQSAEPDQKDDQKQDQDQSQHSNNDDQDNQGGQGDQEAQQMQSQLSQTSKPDTQQNGKPSENESESQTAQDDQTQDQNHDAQQAGHQAMDQEQNGNREEKEKESAIARQPLANEDATELDQATEQWLRRIPDDPAGLWRRKFLYQYQQQYQSQNEEEKPW